MASDYTQANDLSQRAAPARSGSRFESLKLPADRPPAPEPQRDMTQVRDRAIARHARAVQAIFNMQDLGLDLSADEARELDDARKGLNDLRPKAALDAETAYARTPWLAASAARGDTEPARAAILHEKEVRTNPQLRADRFVERWNRYSRAAERAYAEGDYDKRRTYQDSMRSMATSLERDPQVESILVNRKRELGISIDSGRRLGAELAFNHGFDLGRGRGLGIGM